MAPVRSPRQLYKMNLMNPTPAAGADITYTFVKMKESHATVLGLSPVGLSDPARIGTFPVGHPAAGSQYYKNLGGYRYKSWTLIADTAFTVQEKIRQPDGSYETEQRRVKELTIGFPVGGNGWAFIKFLRSSPIFEQLNAVRTPDGRRIPVK